MRKYYGAQFSVLLLNSIVLILHLSLVGLLKYTIDIPHCKCFLLFVLSLCSHKDGLKARIYLIHPIYSQHHYRQFLTSMADRCHTKFFLSMTLTLVLRPSKLDNIKNNNYLKSKKTMTKYFKIFSRVCTIYFFNLWSKEKILASERSWSKHIFDSRKSFDQIWCPKNCLHPKKCRSKTL